MTDSTLLHEVSARLEREKFGEVEAFLREYMEGRGRTVAVGIAAVQLGRAVAAFAFRGSSGVLHDDVPVLWFVPNPVLLGHEGEKSSSIEACLSGPGVRCTVPRWREILCEDEVNGRYVLTDRDAVVWQHEYDHLMGKRIVDVGHMVPPDIGRNDRCPCLSGKKWKKCCGMHEFA